MSRHLLEPLDVAATPELAVLSLLHSAIDMSIRSLLAAHPNLQHQHSSEGQDEDAPSQVIARTIIISASQLFEPIQAYRKAVGDEEVSSANLPF